MGQKGDKFTNEAQLTAELLVEKLQPIGGITSKKMFGGFGIFHEGKMFGIVDSKGNSFLKTDESNEPDFISASSEKHGKMPYYSIPENLIKVEDLVELAKKFIEISK